MTTMELPDTNNVYGIVDCGGRIQEFAARLRQFRQAEVHVKVSQFDGAESVYMDTPGASFHAYKHLDDEFLFNGAVAGPAETVCLYAKELRDVLGRGGFHARFEVYDPDSKILIEELA